MVYDWEKHQQLCYRLYIDEKKSLDEIMEIMRVQHKFTPSKRAFQTQFRRWDFPSKQNPLHKNDRIVARVRELWEKNLSQREMLRVLNEEDGLDVKQRELMRVRTRNRWLLRVRNPEKPTTTSSPSTTLDLALDPELEDGLDLGSVGSGAQGSHQGPQEPEHDLSPQVLAKRRDRLQKLEAQSAERLEARKRRRRTRGWAGLPADPPGPPRFPSETTIDEGKVILNLDGELYREIRSRFARICTDAGVSKKTIAGPERWTGVKDQLIQEIPHLQGVMWADKENLDGKKLALDVICTDVTKRLRTMQQKMTIAEAKQLLGSNPEESRTIRQEFLTVLKEDNFTSKTEAGQEHWEVLKDRWVERSAILQRLLAGGIVDPGYEDKHRAIDVIARDVMKRLTDDQTKRDPNRTRRSFKPPPSSTNGLTQPREASVQNDDSVVNDDQMQDDQGYSHLDEVAQLHQIPSSVGSKSRNNQARRTGRGSNQHLPQEEIQSQPQGLSYAQHNSTIQPNLTNAPALPHSPSHTQSQMLATEVSMLDGGLPIDPQINTPLPVLLDPHTPESVGGSHHAHTPYLSPPVPQSQQQHSHTVASHFVPQHFATHPATPQPQPPIAVYLRLHPSSPMSMGPAIWIAMLSSRTLEELRQVAVKDLAGTVCGRVQGILGEGMTIDISRDDELTAYLAVLEGRGTEGGGAPTFYVQVLAVGNGWKT